MIRLTTLENRFEADLITEALTAEGIDFILRTYQDTAYDGLFVTQKGYGTLSVNEEDETMAMDLVRGIRASIEED
ncbi:MAG: hypothetical protein SV487_04505 [Thermodesulfobacteriota bacterium]|nr:hypothetical protein [Thermodesulfobacteriota bacterium]